MPKTSTSFKAGQEGLGRPKGATNKLTTTVRETVLAVFNDLQDDPESKLEAWAKKNQTEFYKIAAKLIPTEIKGTLDNNITLRIVRNSNRATPATPEPDNGDGATEAV